MAPTTQTDAPLAERRRAWVEKNPLRVYRTREGVTLMAAAALLGVGISTVQAWESGARLPSSEQYDGLATVTAGDATKLAAAWERWHARQPR